MKYSFVSVVKFIDAYKQSPPYQRQQAMLGAPAQINPEAPDPLVRAPAASRTVAVQLAFRMSADLPV